MTNTNMQQSCCMFLNRWRRTSSMVVTSLVVLIQVLDIHNPQYFVNSLLVPRRTKTFTSSSINRWHSSCDKTHSPESKFRHIIFDNDCSPYSCRRRRGLCTAGTTLFSISTEDAATNSHQLDKKNGKTLSSVATFNGTDKHMANGENNENTSEPTFLSSPRRSNTLSCPKVRILKDRMWTRETLEDLTAAEFATKLSNTNENNGQMMTAESSSSSSNFTIASGLFKRRKRAVDFENLLQKLERRIDEMCVLIPSAEEAREANLQECYFLDATDSSSSNTSPSGQGCYSIVDGKGMGSQVYTHEQRRGLLLKLLTDRQELLQAMNREEVREKEQLQQMSEEGGWNIGGEIDSTMSSSSTMGSNNYTSKVVSIENALAQKRYSKKQSNETNNGISSDTEAAADLEEIRNQLQGRRFTNTSDDGRDTLIGHDNSLDVSSQSDNEEGGKDDSEIMKIEQALEGTKASISSPVRTSSKTESPKVYVREDGTVDWEGALQDRSALQLFGTSVWARINGQDPALIDEDSIEDTAKGGGTGGHGGGGRKKVTAKIVETDAIRLEKDLLFKVKQELAAMESAHLSLLESGLSAGAAVANVNLASLDPVLRNRIRSSTEALAHKREEVTFQNLVYELERIFVYLDGEMGNTLAGYVPLQDRLNIAEFGLLESQIESIQKQLEMGEYHDPDVLTIIEEQLNDFKRRLGIDYYVTGLTFDQEAIKRWLADLWEQAKKGIQFYVKGTKLLWNDVVFCSNLLGKAIFQGYILKPREVRTLRRTVKDFFTFIPFVIILIIPLSPIGHVLVFGAIQRFFPDFFPSCYTEQRQNLLQLYESTEYSEVVINETLKEKLIRMGEAMVYFGVQGSRAAYKKLIEMSEAQSESLRTNGSSAPVSTRTNNNVSDSKKDIDK